MKLISNCEEQAKASNMCQLKNGMASDDCKSFFDAYKDCRKEEHKKYIADNAKNLEKCYSFIAKHHHPNIVKCSIPTTLRASPSSSTINALLVKVVEMIKIRNESLNNDDLNLNGGNNATKTKRKMIPISLSFSSSHTQQIAMLNATLARQYLALPVSSYSVLDSNIVSKHKTNPNKFIIRIPLDQAGQSSGMQYKRFNFQVACSVEVFPDVKRGLITMRSGPVYFIPSPTLPSKGGLALVPDNGTSSNKNNGSDVSSSSSDSSSSSSSSREVEYIEIPDWLVWGGGNSNSVIDTAVDDDVAERLQVDRTKLARSSLQAGFVLTLAYNDADAKVGLLKGIFQNLVFSEKKKSVDYDLSGANNTLEVDATIRASVSVNLTSNSDISQAIAFLPVRALLQQIGALTTLSVLKIVSPYLGDLLVADYNRRKAVFAQSTSPTSSSIEEIAP